MPRGGKRPNKGDRVQAANLPGRFGRITDWEPATESKPERWLVQPERAGELARWLTRREFLFAPEPRPWL